MEPEKKDVLRFLKRIGVDTRFVSVVLPLLYINNLRFSKFSRKREELVYKKYPQLQIVRSTIFQKICTRSSKIIGDSLYPQERVLIRPVTILDEVLAIILEPYTRKYGIQLIQKKIELEEIGKSFTDHFDVIALPLTLDHEVKNVLNQIFTGKKIKMQSSPAKIGKFRLIYPLINVPLNWICSYLEVDAKTYPLRDEDKIVHEFLQFLESIIPQVRENILKSSRYLAE